MKSYNLVIAVSFATLSCTQQSEISIETDESTITILSGETELEFNQLYLMEFNEEEWIAVDSSLEKEFDFTIEDISPQIYGLKLDDEAPLNVFLEAGDIEVKIIGNHQDSILVTGSMTHDEWETFRKEKSTYNNELDSLANAYYSAKDEDDSELMKSILEDYDAADLKKQKFVEDYIIGHPKSFVSPYLVARYFMYDQNTERLNGFLDSFSKDIASSIYIPLIEKRIITIEKTTIGNEIPDFALPNPEGEVRSISQMRGSYVLIDFWASWCGSCRRENPNVVKAYKEFNEYGFEVLGVSLDTDSSAWVKAINEDGLIWNQISDLKGWDNSVAKDFGVRSIPTSILIDPEGIVIEKNLMGEDLINYLEDLFHKG